jgi:zinc and cadmium transporter
MNASLYSILSVTVISLVSLVGLFFIGSIKNLSKKSLLILVSFAAGAMIGDVFVHILPELSEEGGIDLSKSLYILSGIVIFYVLEKYIHWHHHHGSADAAEHSTHPVAMLNLVGDGIHNFIDGMIIAAAFVIDVKLGLATSIAVLAHEIPQEIGDYGVLIYSGLSRGKALMYNFFSALVAVAGAIIVLAFQQSGELLTVLTCLAAGSFVYISLADLIPETHKEPSQSFVQLISMLAGIGIMFALLVMG